MSVTIEQINEQRDESCKKILKEVRVLESMGVCVEDIYLDKVGIMSSEKPITAEVKIRLEL